MRTLLTLLGVAAAMCMPTATWAALVSQGTWSGNGHHYVAIYYSYDEVNELTWDEASADLGALFPGYHLATSTSEDENQFIASLVSDLELDWGEWWLGGYQNPEQLNPLLDWQWVTGEPWDYTSWEFREPNDSIVGNENHLAILYDHWWNDEGSAISSVRGYIGESVSVVPIPPAAWLFVGAIVALGPFRRRSGVAARLSVAHPSA